jgi:hypothetical protein
MPVHRNGCGSGYYEYREYRSRLRLDTYKLNSRLSELSGYRDRIGVRDKFSGIRNGLCSAKHCSAGGWLWGTEYRLMFR